MRKIMHWLGVMLFILAVSCLACTAPRHLPVIVASILPFAGQTLCDLEGNPVVVLDHNIMGTMQQHYTMIHELVHVEQVHKYGGCFKFRDQYRQDLHFRFNAEAEAYCRTYQAMVADGTATSAYWNWIVKNVGAYAFNGETLPCEE